MVTRVLELHPARGRERRLERGAIIGRAEGCDIQLDDALVSRRHARVISCEAGTALQDLGSSNGLYINGRRSSGITPLHPGDLIQLGGTMWLVQAR